MDNHHHRAANSTTGDVLKLARELASLALRWTIKINEFTHLSLLCFFLRFHFLWFLSFLATHRFIKELQYGDLDGSSY